MISDHGSAMKAMKGRSWWSRCITCLCRLDVPNSSSSKSIGAEANMVAATKHFSSAHKVHFG
ncbi:hypothetical protein QJS04_geneDACA006860 [Acorus gramineus]|uniref:Uncharacterized protein n=1 Tax=Acorus gramineus TaxID=55184 RepID=A0AAV9AZ70_ACOGR|nr:hypothetical protein QJS04_geneDACA006860 [Acorus gramineus]